MSEEDFLVRLWTMISDPALCRQVIGPPWRLRLARNPRRLRLPRRRGEGVLVLVRRPPEVSP